MRTRTRIAAALIVAGFLLFGFGASAHPEPDGEKTLSPYFFVKSDDPDVDRLPLKSTSVAVNISGVIADVSVTQVYKNEGKRPLEAIYVFPASTRAAVYGMRMTIGERAITAEIEKREDARRRYEDAKQAGKTASLLEQHRPNVFRMNVANILPSDLIRVELTYTELLSPTDAVYEFTYPTVVGPRYSEQTAGDADPWETWMENPYLHQGEPPTYAFDMAVNISSGLPIREVTCPFHKVDITYDGPAFSRIHLDQSEKYGGNRDFILKYRLAGGRIETGLLLFEGKEENFFLLMVQPPKRVSQLRIPPREYIFIVDVSGSMHGFPLDISKKLLKDLIGTLRPTDRFNVLLFSGGSSLMSERSLPATPENISHAVTTIERQRGGGGTRLLPALKRALALPKTDGCSRSVVLATDGYVSVEEEAFDLIRSNLGNANVFPFGIGSSVNRHLIEGMARVGMGEPFIITKPEEAPETAETFRKLIQSPVLTGITVDFGQFQVYDVEPASIPDVLADRPVIVFGKWRGKPRGSIEVRGATGTGSFTEKLDAAQVKALESNSALRYLWARHRITLLADYNRLSPNDERVREVTSLGLTYNLLTAHTSFIAVDTQIRAADGQTVTVKQPLPLPQGVSDLAVGNEMSFKTKAQIFGAVPLTVARECTPGRGQLQSKDETSTSDKASEKIHMAVKEVAVSGGALVHPFKTVIESALAAINTCYREGSGSCPKGEVVFTMVVEPDGRVKNASMRGDQSRFEDFARCTVKMLTALQFQAREGGNEVLVKITFTLG